MPNTYSQIYLHYVFSPKYRQALIKAEFEEELYKYIAGIIKKLVLKARKKIGKVKIDHGGTRCKTPNIKESLQRKRIYKRKKKN